MPGVAVRKQYVVDYNHSTDTEYKQLRDQAQVHSGKHQQLSSKSQNAYRNGDKALAKQLSEQARIEFNKFQNLNNQAAEFVFVENNKDSMSNEIDLHGLYVSEAEYVVKKRLIYGNEHSETDVRIIVGKGMHSAHGISKLKPAIEELCTKGGFKWRIDRKNDGVIIVDAQSGHIPDQWHRDITKISANNTSTSNNVTNGYTAAQPMQYTQPTATEANGNVSVLVKVVKLFCTCMQ